MGYTVKVSNVSTDASERDIYDFFAFSGEISSIQTQPAGEDAPGTQIAYVTFQEERSLETALLLTGAVIAEKPVTVEMAEGYVPPPTSAASTYGDGEKKADSGADAIKKAESMMATLLARGYILGKDAMEKAKALDQQHELSSKAYQGAETISKSAAELDSKYSISKRFVETTAQMSRSISTVDQKYQVSSKTKEALTATEKSLSEAGQYVMQNKYVASSTGWLMGALGQLKTIVTEVQQQASEKVSKAEEERVQGHREQATSQLDEEEDPAKKAQDAASSGAPTPAAAAAPPPSLMDAPAPIPVPGLTPSNSAKARSSADPPVF